jgi:hypothetical protein
MWGHQLLPEALARVMLMDLVLSELVVSVHVESSVLMGCGKSPY